MSNDVKSPTTNRWLVVLGTVLVQLGVGSFYAWSIFNTGFELKSGGAIQVIGGVKKVAGGLPAASVSFTFTLGMLCLSLATLLGVPLVKRFGIRRVSIITGIIYGLSILGLTTVNHSIWTLWLFGGVLVGATDGILYLTTLSNAIKWFPDRSGLISGISIASYGLGSFIFKYIDMAIAGGTGAITGTNIVRTLTWWGILALILCVVGAFLLKDAPEDPEAAVEDASKPEHEEFTTSEMLHTSQAYLMFICLTTAVMFMGLLGAAVTNMAARWTQVPAEVSTWAGTAAAATFVAVVAIANTIGRFVFGWVSDHTGRKPVFFITYIVQLVVVAMLLMNSHMHMGLFYVMVIALAACFGGNITVFPTFVGDYFGLKNHTRNYSLIYQGFGIGAIIVGFLMASGNPLNPPVANPLNFHLTLWVLLIMTIISLVIFVFIKKPVKK